ncbi:MAG: glycine-rich protein [Candidatus Marinimicrobia bacterium]|nr:glycine-rich protein [Candidatus Neomarinimicrobiota bacterium]
MRKNKYLLVAILSFYQIFSAENDLLSDQQPDDGIPSDYVPTFQISELEMESQEHTNISIATDDGISVQMSSLDGGQSYTFTNCGTTGAQGPTQTSINNAYSGTSLANSVTALSGMQKWIVPYTGDYHFEVKGAMGGSQNSTYRGGYGAVISGAIELQQGQTLIISVGQKGSNDGDSPGGGGATAVAIGTHYNNATPLFVAGGGGGRSSHGTVNYAAINGQSGNNGGSCSGYGSPGSNGNGAGYGGTSNNSGSGAGFYTGPDNSTSTSGSYARGFRQGFRGSTMAGPYGGFGGGGAGSNSNNDWDKGGAGGWSGGAQAFDAGQGGGGGSYVLSSVSNQFILGGNSANNAGHGVVTITTNSNQGNFVPVAEDQTVVGNEDEEFTITLSGTDEDGGSLTYSLESNPSHGVAVQEYKSALDFDGVNDEVIISGGNFISGNEQRSISVWADGSSGNIVSLGHGWTSNARFSILITNQRRVLVIGQWNDWSSNYYLPTGQMTHLVLTHDGSTLKLYADGVLQEQTSKSYNTNANMPIMIGTNCDDRNDEYFNGSIDDVIITRDVLTSNEVSEIYNGNNPTIDNIVAMYDFNEGNGNSTLDISGNGNDGSVNGASWITQGSSNIITYNPNPNYHGSDSFTFSVSDGIDVSNQNATVHLNILPVNDYPTINSTPVLDIVEGHSYEYAISLHDIDGDQLSLTAPTKPNWLDLTAQYSYSLDFDGSNDYVSVNDHMISTNELTFETWIYPHNVNGWRAIRNETGWNGGDIHFQILNSKLEFSLHGNSPTDQWFDHTFVTNTWTHIALVYDGPNNRTRLYINGIFSEEVNYSSTRNADLGNFQIGNWANSRPFDGLITDFRIWNGIRTESEIQENMNSQLIGTEDGLVAYYTFEDGNGNILTDQTSNNYNGSIAGALWTNESALPISTVLHGTPNFSDGGLHNVVLTANDGNGGSISQNFAISVAVTHLEITGGSGFRILSSPVSGAIFGDLLEELWTQGSEGSDHEGADPNVWTFDNGWVPVSDLYNDVLDAGEGFVIYVFSDTDYDGDDDLPVTIGIDGTINESEISVSSNSSHWNLVGNPYGLHVDINQMLSDNSSKFNSTVYRMDHTNPGYRTHNGVVGNIDEGLIKPFDGFWIQAGPNGDVFEFSENCIKKGHISNNGGGRSTTDESTGSAVFTFTSGEFTSSVYLSFTANGHINLDPADARRIIPMSPAEHLTSMVRESSKSLSINNLPSDLTTDISFDLDAMLLAPTEEGYETQSEQVNLAWDITDLPEGISLSLINNMTGQTVNLYGYPSANVALPSKGGFAFPDEIMETYPYVGDAQFTLSVYTDIASSDNEETVIPEEITLHNAYPNPFNPSTMISFDIMEMDKVSLKIYDLTGRQVASLVNRPMAPGYHQITWNPGLLPSGVYLVELTTGGRSFNQKITYIK